MRKMYRISLLPVLLFLMLALFSAEAFAMGMVKMTMKVVDEDGKPVEGAEVQFCTFGGCLKKNVITGITDSNGNYSIFKYSIDGVIGGAVEKAGYYYSVFHRDFRTTTLGMYRPWNKEKKVVLRPKIKPVPMYVRNKWVQIPVLDKEIGLDLEKFDWVAPYGLGTKADFIFKITCRYNTIDDFDTKMTMTFSNKFDGIQKMVTDRGGDFGVGSIMRLPRYAPETGYAPKLERGLTSGPERNILTETISNYFFRVRSEVDEKGNLVRAMYGKIVGEVDLAPKGNGVCRIHFKYYLNPDYTRNLEYDTQANLFSPLPDGETPIVGDP